MRCKTESNHLLQWYQRFIILQRDVEEKEEGGEGAEGGKGGGGKGESKDEGGKEATEDIVSTLALLSAEVSKIQMGFFVS